MELLFKRGGVEKFLLVFLYYNADEVPQYKIISLAGSGPYYQNIEYLKNLGLVEETSCYSEEKGATVKCVRLTEKGKRIVDLLKQMREIVFGRVL